MWQSCAGDGYRWLSSMCSISAILLLMKRPCKQIGVSMDLIWDSILIPSLPLWHNVTHGYTWPFPYMRVPPSGWCFISKFHENLHDLGNPIISIISLFDTSSGGIGSGGVSGSLLGVASCDFQAGSATCYGSNHREGKDFLRSYLGHLGSKRDGIFEL